MTVSSEMQQVIGRIKKRVQRGEQECEYVSPNYVADTAYNMGYSLSSDEVVYISDNIETLLKSS